MLILMSFLLNINIFNEKFIDYQKLKIKKGLVYLDNKLFTGLTGAYYSNGYKKFVSKYKNGKPKGKFIVWDDRGKKLQEGNYNGIKIYNKKKLKEMESYLNDEFFYKRIIKERAEKFTGCELETFNVSKYSNKKVAEKILDGNYTCYMKLNKNKKIQISYKNGVLNGKLKAWDKNGNYTGYEKFKNGKKISSVIISSEIRFYEKKILIDKILYGQDIKRRTYFSNYDDFVKNDIYNGKLIESWSKKDGLVNHYKIEKRKKLLNHYKNYYGIPYIVKNRLWCYRRYDKFLDDFIEIFKKKAENNISYTDKRAKNEKYLCKEDKENNISDFYRTFSCKNDKCKIVYYLLTDIKSVNKFEELNLNLENGYFFPIIYIFETEINLKDKNNENLKYMFNC